MNRINFSNLGIFLIIWSPQKKLVSYVNPESSNVFSKRLLNMYSGIRSVVFRNIYAE